MTDFVSTLGANWTEEDETDVVEPEQPQPEPSEPDPEPEVEPEPEKVKEEKADESKEPAFYREMKHERSERQRLERELAEERASKTKQPQPEPVKVDAYEDPDGFQRHVESLIEQRIWEDRAERSGQRAEEVHGRDKVMEAIAWAQEQASRDPGMEARIRLSASPVEHVVREYQQSQTLQALNGRSLDDFVKERAAEMGLIDSSAGASVSASNQPSQPKPPRSLAQAPGTGSKTLKPDDGWDEVFASKGMGLRR